MHVGAFSGFAAGLALMSLAAFWKPYFSHLAGVSEPYVHLHVAVVVCWMAALVVQPILIRRRRVDVHRALGRTSYIVAPMVGVSALLLAHSRFSGMDKTTFAASAFTLYLPLTSTVAFMVSYALAIAFRRHRTAHAAFMLGTALALVDPISVRLIYFFTPAGDNHWIYDIIGVVLIILVLVPLMIATRHVPRARNAFAALLGLYLTLWVGWLTLAQTEAFTALAGWFIRLPLT